MDGDGSAVGNDSPASAASPERALLDAISGPDDAAVAEIVGESDDRFVSPFIEILRVHELAWIPLSQRETNLNALLSLRGRDFGLGWDAGVEWSGTIELQPPPGSSVLTNCAGRVEQHPETLVLSLRTGYAHPYEQGSAYSEHFGSDETIFPAWQRRDVTRAITNTVVQIMLVLAQCCGFFAMPVVPSSALGIGLLVALACCAHPAAAAADAGRWHTVAPMSVARQFPAVAADGVRAPPPHHCSARSSCRRILCEANCC